MADSGFDGNLGLYIEWFCMNIPVPSLPNAFHRYHQGSDSCITKRIWEAQKQSKKISMRDQNSGHISTRNSRSPETCWLYWCRRTNLVYNRDVFGKGMLSRSKEGYFYQKRPAIAIFDKIHGYKEFEWGCIKDGGSHRWHFGWQAIELWGA